MRKEVLYAIIFGIILGGIVLYGINLANKSVSSELPGQTGDSKVTPTPAVQAKKLSITYPQDHSVFAEKTITLLGRANPDANLAITSESDDVLITASPEGSFSAEINLISGENIITVTELQPDLTTQTQTISVIQTTNIPE